ncbi:post-GPI attachment to proteins factor 3 isoform X1 [Neodiprion pinetum]|uniref:post-GPI attachment to proteins factor 3 isoform X1 n=2 Tax=Neodiprion pinetum TaxID=441929 RepID=UPI001EE1060C|nr:post-GPI attachment to proteins factor 3 isoform X1 [Neodiprion pinetum]
MSNLFYGLIIILGFTVFNAECSNGDRSTYYRECLRKCYTINCTTDMSFKESAPLELRLLLWTCDDNCRYICMWKTVDYFASQGWNIPQFYGKWPFARMLGLQEPASVIFSILNFQVHYTMYKKFKQALRPSNPMKLAWSYLSIVCMNGWIWSTVFHARDKTFTEVMDYSCAFAMVLTFLYCVMLRIALENYRAVIFVTCGYLTVLYTHLSHLWSGKINYGYNMKFNLALGLLTFLVTMAWWYRNRKELEHASLIAWFNIGTVLVTLLEVADFPPILWTFDAHSLWHASTVPLAILLYRFIIQDCKHLQKLAEKI